MQVPSSAAIGPLAQRVDLFRPAGGASKPRSHGEAPATGTTYSYGYDSNGRYTASLSAFIGLTTAYDADNVYLAVQQSRALDTVAQTSNQTAAARGVDRLPMDNAVKTALLNVPLDASARSAMNQT